MHPYLMEQQIKARNENLHRELSRARPALCGAGPGPGRRCVMTWAGFWSAWDCAWPSAGSGARGAVVAGPGGGPVITHG